MQSVGSVEDRCAELSSSTHPLSWKDHYRLQHNPLAFGLDTQPLYLPQLPSYMLPQTPSLNYLLSNWVNRLGLVKARREGQGKEETEL